MERYAIDQKGYVALYAETQLTRKDFYDMFGFNLRNYDKLRSVFTKWFNLIMCEKLRLVSTQNKSYIQNKFGFSLRNYNKLRSVFTISDWT